MDFPYLAKIVKLNTAALAAIASAPPPPEPAVAGAVMTDTIVTWNGFRTVHAFAVRWRRSDTDQWDTTNYLEIKGNDRSRICISDVINPGNGHQEGVCGARAILPHIRIDDWVFGVSSVSGDGFESPVASAVPGGAFRPYVAPEQK